MLYNASVTQPLPAIHYPHATMIPVLLYQLDTFNDMHYNFNRNHLFLYMLLAKYYD